LILIDWKYTSQRSKSVISGSLTDSMIIITVMADTSFQITLWRVLIQHIVLQRSE